MIESSTATTPTWSSQPRPFLTRIGLICGAFFACWHLGVRHWNEKLGWKEARLFEVTQAIARESSESLPDDELHLAEQSLSTASRQLTAWTNQSSESAGLYERFRKLADYRKIKIGRVEPKTLYQLPVPDALKPPKDVEPPRVESYGYSLQVSGTYNGIAGFLTDIDTSMGASKVVSFRMTAGQASKGQLVEATLETLHVQLNTELSATDSNGAGKRDGE